ncbi:response regulator transcription factor [Actinoplanes sp. NPDC051851]|uniref:response regulator transcription factor n=1 Tax=Actinoplanes sp. NPDC051851 TaxID=3154753 RepID=UPI003445D37A
MIAVPEGVSALARQRILVVEDDPGIRALLSSTVKLVGYDVRDAPDARAARRELERFEPHLLVVDVMLPDIDGIAFTRALREAGRDTPVLFLTARAQTVDRLAGLRAGGDDYVTKPFNVEELLLRIRAILGRLHPVEGPLQYADLALDPHAHSAHRAGRQIPLTPTEYRLLEYLLRHPEQVLTREQIVQDVWGYDFDGDPGIVDTYVRYLRRKVDRLGAPMLHTVRGIGYRLHDSGGKPRGNPGNPGDPGERGKLGERGEPEGQSGRGP